MKDLNSFSHTILTAFGHLTKIAECKAVVTQDRSCKVLEFNFGGETSIVLYVLENGSAMLTSGAVVLEKGGSQYRIIEQELESAACGKFHTELGFLHDSEVKPGEVKVFKLEEVVELRLDQMTDKGRGFANLATTIEMTLLRTGESLDEVAEAVA